jgi:hypothetical protein
MIIILFIAAVVTGGGVRAQKLPHRNDLKVKRNLLEKNYPAFKTFEGDMHAGLIPAVLLGSNTSNAEDFSSYFFWLFQPDTDSTEDVSFHLHMLTMHQFRLTINLLTLHQT